MMGAVLAAWKSEAETRLGTDRDVEGYYQALISLLRDQPEHVSGLVFFDDSEPLGFVAWDLSGAKTANLLANLATKSIPGLADHLIVMTCSRLRSLGVRLLNLGGSELESLDAFKRKYLPVESLPLASARISTRFAARSDLDRFPRN